MKALALTSTLALILASYLTSTRALNATLRDDPP